MMVPVGRIIIFRVVPKSEFIRAMNYLSVPAMLGPAAGPLLGGFITTYLHWRLIFFINVPIGILGIYLTNRHIVNTREPHPGPLDWIGFFLSAGGAALFLLGLSLIGGEMTSNSNAVGMCVCGAFLLADLCAVRAARQTAVARSALSSHSHIPGERARRIAVPDRPRRVAVSAAAAVAGGARQERVRVRPDYLCVGLRRHVHAHASRRRCCGALDFATCWSSMRRLSGIAIAICGAFFPGTPTWLIWFVVLLGGFFPALQFTSLNSLTYAEIASRDVGRATSLGSVVQQMSLGLGVTIGGIVLQISHMLHGHTHRCVDRISGRRSSWWGCARSLPFR